MKAFDWFDRDKIECIFEGRSTSIFVENLETKMRAEITGWTMKYLEVWLASIIFLLLQIIAS